MLIMFPQKVWAEKLSVGVYPPLVYIQAATPNSIKTPLTIQNSSNESVSLQISFRPFTSSKAENGEVSFIDNSSFDKLVKDQKISVLDNGSLVSKIELGAKQSKTLALMINLPSEEKTSDYYFSVVFTSTPRDPELVSGSINIDSDFRQNDKEITAKTYVSMGVAANVLLSVNPILVKPDSGRARMTIEEFSTLYLLDQGPVPFKLRVKNEGEYIVAASGNILISNMFGQTVGKINIPSSYVLKNTARVLSSTKWEEKFLLGYYTATLNLKLDGNKPAITKTISFIALPFQNAIMVITALGIFLLIRSRMKAKPRLTRLIKNKDIAKTT